MLWSKQRWGRANSPLPTPHSRCPLRALLRALSQHQGPTYLLFPCTNYWTTLTGQLSGTRSLPLPSLWPPLLSRGWDGRLAGPQLSWIPLVPTHQASSPTASAGRNVWVKDHERKAVIQRAPNPFVHTSPLPCFKNLIVFLYKICGAWIKTHILNIPRGILHLDRAALGKTYILSLPGPTSYEIHMSRYPMMCPKLCCGHFDI